MNDLGAFLPTILASAFGGGLVAGAFGVYNRVASQKDEHDKWLRDQKVEAYCSYLNLAQALVVTCSGYRGGQVTKDDAFAAFSQAQLGALELLAPGPLREVARELETICDQIFHAIFYDTSLDEGADFRAAIDEYLETRQAFIVLAQADLDIQVPEYPTSGSHLVGL